MIVLILVSVAGAGCDDDSSSSFGTTTTAPPQSTTTTVKETTTTLSTGTTASSLPGLGLCSLDSLTIDPDGATDILVGGRSAIVVIEASGAGGTFDLLFDDGGAGGSSSTDSLAGIGPGTTRFTIEYTPPVDPPSPLTLTVELSPHSLGNVCSDSSDGASAVKAFSVTAVYAVTFGVPAAVGPIGALQFEVQFGGEFGGWDSTDGVVSCTSAGSLAAFNDSGAGLLRAALVNLVGLPTPGPVAVCDVVAGNESSLFQITVTDASDVAANPISPLPTVEVVDIQRAD